MRVRFLHVARPDACCEAVDRVIRARDDFVDVAERSGGDDGPEDFFLHHFHVVVGIDEDGGLHEVALVAFARTAGGGLRAFLDSRFEIAADAIELLFGNERAEIAFRIESGTDADFRGGSARCRRRPCRKFSFRRRAASRRSSTGPD